MYTDIVVLVVVARHTEDSLFFTPSRVGNFDHEESKVAGKNFNLFYCSLLIFLR